MPLTKTHRALLLKLAGYMTTSPGGVNPRVVCRTASTLDALADEGLVELRDLGTKLVLTNDGRKALEAT